MSDYTDFIEYEKSNNVKAKLFTYGDEDGFFIRYATKKPIDGEAIVTTGIPTKESFEVSVPFVTSDNGTTIISKGFECEYLCVTNTGYKYFVDKDEFELEYSTIQSTK